MVVAKKVTYSGNVQGVGFRYTAQHIAGGFTITGYVRNLASGEVELVAEGEAEEVGGFLGKLAQVMGGYIGEARETAETPTGFREFRIRH
jgi:acylphosphatase